MPFKKTTLRKTVSFEIPQDRFVQILDYDSVNFKEFDLPSISTVLDQIDGVSNTEYSGHYGSHVFADFEADEDGTYPQIEEFETVLEDMIEDVRRISTTFPELVDSPRQNIPELLLDDDERGHRRFLSFVYSGEDVLVAAGSEPREVKLFFRSGDTTRWVDRRMSQRAWEALVADRVGVPPTGLREKLYQRARTSRRWPTGSISRCRLKRGSRAWTCVAISFRNSSLPVARSFPIPGS